MKRILYGVDLCKFSRYDSCRRRTSADCKWYEVHRKLRRSVCSSRYRISSDVPALYLPVREDHRRCYRRRCQRIENLFRIKSWRNAFRDIEKYRAGADTVPARKCQERYKHGTVLIIGRLKNTTWRLAKGES